MNAPDHPTDRTTRPIAGESGLLRVQDLGQIEYATGLATQRRIHDEVLASRAAAESEGRVADHVGVLLLLEHVPPVITVSRRPTALQHLVATPDQLRRAGVEVAETDRGGDITYHGPGQLVAYPILDLNRLGLGLGEYMRLLERVVIDVCRVFGVGAHRDSCATGVWVGGVGEAPSQTGSAGAPCAAGGAKLCAMGVRIRRWVSMHGLALNVTTDLRHFDLIVPCGLAGRSVTSLQRELGAACPSMPEVKRALADKLSDAVRELAAAPRAITR